MPSWPAALISTGIAPVIVVVTPKIPAMKALVWFMPMRVVLDSPTSPT